MSTEDGPGLRTTVFTKGCPLSCEWCHNPESIDYQISKEWLNINCIGCLECVTNCEANALSYVKKEILTNLELCNLCLKCVEKCPTSAMRAVGEDLHIEQLYKELIKDKAYFTGKGGITLSGGEIMMQPGEAFELCNLLKKEGIHIAIDTSGQSPYSNFEKILPVIDLILYDLKIFDSSLHESLCGVGNSLIFENLLKLNKETVNIWLRTPIIPGVTDSIQNIREIAQFLKTHQINFDRWELCAFNNLCLDKYERKEINWIYKSTQLVTEKHIILLVNEAKIILGNDKDIHFTGTTLFKEEKS